MQIITRIINVTLNSDLVFAVKKRLAKIGLSQGTFINGFVHFLANNRFLPFKKMTRKEEETAQKIATLNALEENVCEYNKKKKIQKSVNNSAYIAAKQVLQTCHLTMSRAIRMLYEKFVLSGEMPYQFIISTPDPVY